MLHRSRLVGIAFSLILAGSVTAAQGTGEISTLRSADPLTQPAPRLLNPLVLPLDDRPAEERIVSSLWAKALSNPGVLLDIIVTLQEPELASSSPGSPSLKAPQLEALRVQNLAALEHRFASSATAVGMLDLRGLSHLPVVFGQILPEKLLELAALPEVYAVEEDRPIRAARVEGGDLTRATQLRNQQGGTGAGIGVAVLDTGVDNSHAELASRVVREGNFTDDPGSGTDDGDGHGTAVAGIIAGTSGGMAPQANIWAIKILDDSGSGELSWEIDALNTLFAQRNASGGLHVINMSLGENRHFNTTCDGASPAEATALNQLANAGVAIFVASGNEAVKNGVSVPACLSAAVAVGAVYDANLGPANFGDCSDSTTAADKITCYSNSGAPLDLLAPADCARTPRPGGGHFGCFNGTSAAAPYAAGVAAQLLSANPGTTATELIAAMTSTGRPRTDSNGITRNRIDAISAHEALDGGGPTGPCVPGATTLCIDDQAGDRRFQVTMQFNNNQGGSGFGTAIALNSLGVTRGGLFWIGSQGNPEMLIKVLNACSSPLNSYWVFYAATTNQGLVTTVTDTQTGRVWSRTNPQGTPAAPVQDTRAFPCS